MLDAGVLLLALGALLAGAVVLDATGNVVRRQMEDQSWAEGRCTALAPRDVAETHEYSACVKRELGKSDLEAVLPQVRLALIGAAMGACGAALLRRRRQPRSGGVMKLSVDGSG